jgi:iron complex outermembrane receptor protein
MMSTSGGLRLKKRLNISAPLGFLLIMTLFAGLALGQEEDDFVELDVENEFTLLDDAISADEIEAASKHRQSIFWSPSAITVFTKEQIRSSGANTLYDLLRRVPGFDVYEVKPSYPIVGARALTDDSNNLVLVLIDGREALVELVGFALWAALDVDLLEIERVEIVRGPGSTLYGANAFTAVVNITTVQDRATGLGDMVISAGETGQRWLFGRAHHTWDLAGGVLSFSAGLGTEGINSPSDRRDNIKVMRLRSHGYLRYRQGRRLDLSLHAGAVEGDGTLFMHVGDMQSSNVLNHFTMAKAEFGFSDAVRLKIQVYHNRTRADFSYRIPLQSYDTWVADVPDFYIDTNTVDGQAQLDFHITKNLLLISGANLRYAALTSDNVIPQEISELRGAVFTNAQWHLFEDLQLTAGIRFDFNTETDEALSPRAVAVYRPFENHAFRLGYGLAFRKPAFIESRAHFKVSNYNPAFPEIVDKLKEEFGNEDLVNEKVHSFEAGWRAWLMEDKLQIAVDLFFNLYQDNIYFHVYMPTRMGGLPDVPNSSFQFENQDGDVVAFGGEAEVVWNASDDLTLWGNLGARRVTDQETGETLPSEPILRVNLGGRYDSGNGVFTDLALHYTSSRKMKLMNPEEPLETYREYDLGDALLLVGRLGCRWVGDQREVEAGLTLRLPLNRAFREFAGMPMPESLHADETSDFGGERIVRLLSLYLRSSF